MTTVWMRANGLTFEVAQAGAGDHLALCLHGFPELNYSWRYQMSTLAKKGYRVWAPKSARLWRIDETGGNFELPGQF